MSKKKSKTQKQKQAKAIKSSSLLSSHKKHRSFGGVPIVSNGKAENNTNSSSWLSNTTQKKARLASSPLQQPVDYNNDKKTKIVADDSKNEKKDENKDDDFEREHASLRERYKNRLCSNEYRKKTTPTTPMMNFAPATLFAKKNVEQMVHDATDRIARTEVGDVITTAITDGALRPSTRQNRIYQECSTVLSSSSEEQNSYAILTNEEEEFVNLPILEFDPPSFVVPSNNTFIDPDL